MMILWQLAAVVGGSSTGLLGAYVVGLRMPFLGVGLAHAAMAGAVFAQLLGWPALSLGLGTCLASGAAMAWLATMERGRTDLGTVSGILLSLMMGLAFLGIGLNRGEMTPMLGLMWGSLLFVEPGDVVVMGILGGLLVGFVALCRRPLEALLFSRELSRVSGIRERLLLGCFMVLASLIITLNLQIVGGLMIYSLLTNPAAAAYELAGSMRQVRVLSALLGLAGTWGGFWLSVWLDVPTGACIVIVSTLIYALALAFAHRRRVAHA